MGNYYSLARLKGLATAITIMATMTACSTGGGNPLGALDSLTGDSKYAPEFIKANIIANKSTKASIREKFGAPNSVRDNLGNNSSTWSYDRRESGLNTIKKMAIKYSNRYGSGTAASSVLQGESRVGDAQEILDDTGTVTGSNAPGQKTVINEIDIDFKGDVVSSFRTY
ncbi:hypothetical protein BTW15_16770 [Pseudomonas syringae pv. tomato]|uniref:Lipoprotein n=6 Tax=Pseudomonas syringae group TaxID=136849 RepID=Q888W9_PSESM|nr:MULTISPECIES: hypothetical protein [Pseudomonas]AAO54429.1 hypothetical protein PSPTO_0895 [Pseudomonas syringae pv. tomato str. DC3000]KKI24630.1 hypothetical protein WX98_19030 [Pseudomonas syringae pv. persicae]KPB79062.1 Uncharacterized protein AC505_0200 [Pseudomonas syringae pv. maculicola]KPB91848.1 Uncharacterized protein AC502_5063 [Pseudomonas syringae pv. maculicola]KPW44703.1 Uncharacterized protein ALO88_01748 [Pseudomonas syringae pv. antirrhini]